MDPHDLQNLREEYAFPPLDESKVDPNPFKQFDVWFQQAVSAGIEEPNAMVVATSSKDGKPSARGMLLKGADERGFVFFTNYESRKALELESNPHAAIVFMWLPLAHQVRIEGKTERVSREESKAYFESRPLGSRLSALISRQSSVVPSRDYLEEKLKEAGDRYLDEDPPLPEFWGGYRLVPTMFEFWQGRPNRLHDRIRYKGTGDGKWIIERLSP